MRSYIVFALLAACTSDASGPEGALEQALASARPAVVDVVAPTQRDATRTQARLSLSYTAGDARQTLSIARRIDTSGARFRVRDERTHTQPSSADPAVERSASDRVESVFDGHALAWRRGDGQWIERDVLDGLPGRTLGEARGLGDYVVAAFVDYLKLTSIALDAAHPATIDGAAVTWSVVSLDAAVRPLALSSADLDELRAHEPTVVRWIAANHRPTKIDGEVARDATGHVVAARLSLTGATTLPEGPATFAIELVVGVEPLPSDASFELPADRLPESRERPWLMIEDVVGDGLLPPYR